jgi:hypothetical protein
MRMTMHDSLIRISGVEILVLVCVDLKIGIHHEVYIGRLLHPR